MGQPIKKRTVEFNMKVEVKTDFIEGVLRKSLEGIPFALSQIGTAKLKPEYKITTTYKKKKVFKPMKEISKL